MCIDIITMFTLYNKSWSKDNSFNILLNYRGPHHVMKCLQCVVLMRIKGVQSAEMVGERCRKELVGDIEKWRSKEKVWKKLE